MKSLKLGLALTFLGLFIFACSQNPTNPSATNTIANKSNSTNTNSPTNTNQATPANDEFAAIKKTFSDKCVQCHRDTGEGGDVDIEGDKFKVPSFKDSKIAALDDKKYTRVIEEGDDKMPGFKKQLTPDQIAGLIKYIRQEFQGK
jgi:mono/diheme cytochrome c family protein